MNIQSVAIIGAGASGLSTAKYLLAEKKFSKIDIYEQRTATGGIWNTSPLSNDPGFRIPHTSPTVQHEYINTAVHDDDDDDDDDKRGNAGHIQFISPVYDQLETNIPHGLMSYTDLQFPPDTPLFPHHATVLAYLTQYGRDVEHLITFGTQVRRVSKVSPSNNGAHGSESEETAPAAAAAAWKVESRDLLSGTDRPSRLYDAVVVASGHYTDPFVPDIPGMVEFDAAHPGSIQHSKFYRRPTPFAGKKVLIVGNSSSGIDISFQIATVSQLPVLISVKTTTTTPLASTSPTSPPAAAATWSHHIGQITQLLPATRGVRVSTGAVYEDIDVILFCTGYHYSFPFLDQPPQQQQQQQQCSPPPPSPPSPPPPRLLAPDGSYVDRLWEHMLHADDPTLAFLVIPKRVVPFPLAESQAAVLARIWAGRLPVPSHAEMHAWVRRRAADCADAPRARHVLSYPQDVDYINRLHALSSQATPTRGVGGLENDGVGKLPPYWDDETRWVRSQIFEIKAASRALGDRRGECKSLKQLGFEYKSPKAD